MERNEASVYQVRDFPLSIADAQAELDSLQHVLDERTEFSECVCVCVFVGVGVGVGV